MRTVWLLSCLVAYSAMTTSGAEPANAQSGLGLNLSGVVDYSTEMPFVDLFRSSRPWISQADGKPWGQGPALELDERGWVKRLAPGQYATTLMAVHGGHPAGKYVCKYDGEGELDFQNNARIVEQRPGRILLEVSDKEGLFLHLRKTNPADPVRNIRVLMPGTEDTVESQPFNASFLQRTGQFRVLRFMDWMSTNGSEVVEWSDRPRVEDATQTRRGVALEIMVDLSNRLQADPWFCVPHLASDDYVRQFARQVKKELDPARKVYVEYSNEVWNGQFAQARYAREQGRKAQLADNDFQAQLRFHSRRSVQIFQIFEQEFGGRERLVRVLGSQAANPWVSEQVATFEDAFRHADVVAIAPYFGHSLGKPDTAAAVVAGGVDGVLARCHEEIVSNRPKIEAVVAMARQHGLGVVTYEGGQHLVGYAGAENNDALTQVLQAANRDPRMKQLYLEDLRSWREAGGGLFTVFSSVNRPSKWGSWGMLEAESQDPATAPKYQAIVEFLRANPRWW